MSGPPDVLELDATLRRELVERFARRPWPPPSRSDDDLLFAGTARRILDDLANEPPMGFPDCADWLLVVPEDNAAAVRSEPIDSRLLIAGTEQWTELDEALRAGVEGSAAVLRLGIAGHSPVDWAEQLPGTAPNSEELSATLGSDATAVLAQLHAPAFGEIELLHVWCRSPDGPAHVADLSGVLSMRSDEP